MNNETIQFPENAYPITVRIFGRSGDRLWSGVANQPPLGMIAHAIARDVAAIDWASHAPLAVRIEFADGTFADRVEGLLPSVVEHILEVARPSFKETVVAVDGPFTLTRVEHPGITVGELLELPSLPRPNVEHLAYVERQTAECPCGWKGRSRETFELAMNDAIAHEQASALAFLVEARLAVEAAKHGAVTHADVAHLPRESFAASPEARPDRHLAYVEPDLESMRRGGSTRMAACICGWRGPQRGSLEMATDDALTHEREPT
jgi:hypothetical protein